MKHLFNLNDGRGPVELVLRRVLDRIGVDPYDVDLAMLRLHCDVYERGPVSRFRTKSPCWAVRRVDWTVHVLLPAMLAERYPNVARALLETSPRWGQAHPTPLAPVKRARV